MHDNEIEVDEALVRRLLATLLPGLADLPLSMIEPWGTDNAIWRLGDDLVVRLPRIDWASEQVQHEATWLPRLAPRLPVAVPEPIAIGEPGYGYPFQWAVHRWLPGEGASLSRMSDPAHFAHELAAVVRALQAMPINGAPAASNRARPLHEYNDSALRAIESARSLINARQARAVWEEALAAEPLQALPSGPAETLRATAWSYMATSPASSIGAQRVLVTPPSTSKSCGQISSPMSPAACFSALLTSTTRRLRVVRAQRSSKPARRSRITCRLTR